MTTKRRGLALFGAFALIVSACGGGTPSASTAPSASSGGGSTAPSASGASTAPSASGSATTGGGGTFSFVVDSEPSTLATESDDLPTSWIEQFLYTTLYQPNYKLEYVPLAADGQPEISADGLTWTVKIKKGILFHDGTEMKADDVKFSYDLHLSKNCRGNPDVCSTWQDNVASIDKIDDYTIKIQLKQKFAPFLSSGLGATIIVPKKALEDSLARLQQSSSAVSAADAKALDDKVTGGTATEDANGKATPCADAKTAPDTCKYATYTAEMEALLQKAGVALTSKTKYNTGGTSGTDFDPEAYGQGLAKQVADLSAALGSSSIDQIAAAIRILDFGNHPIGSGPMKFVAYNAGQNIELARWEKYYGGGTSVDANKIPEKAFAIVIRDSATATAALGNDEIQWQQKMESFDAYTQVKDNPKLQIAEYPDNGYYFIAFNVRPGHIYSDKNLRTAFGMCIDHDKTVEVATSGNGVPVYANTPPFSWAFNPDTPKYTLDPAKATQLIESSGWKKGDDGIYAKDGKRLSSTLFVRTGRPQRIAFAQLAADQLKQNCGIEVKPQEADLNTVLVPKVINFPNDFETYLGGWSTSLDPDDYSIFHSSQIPTKDKPVANDYPGWKNPEADKLLADGRTTLDQAGRKAIYAQFQTLIHEDAPYYFLWADKAHTGLAKAVQSQNQPFDLTSVGINYYNVDAWTITSQ